MKTIIILTFVLTVFCGTSQTVVTQNVAHGSFSGDYNGCTTVRLVVDYTLNGIDYSVSSANTLIPDGTSAVLSATLPSGRPTIVGKKLIISSADHTYIYSITGGSNTFSDEFGYCFCDISGTGIMVISESTTVITYYLTDIIGQGCTP